MFRKMAGEVLTLLFLLVVVPFLPFVPKIQAQTDDSGLCAQYMPSSADVMQCLNDNYGPASISIECTDELCDCANWEDAVTFESVNTSAECPLLFCALHASSGFSNFTLCFPPNEAGAAYIAEESDTSCMLWFDTSNNRALAITNLDLDAGTYGVRFTADTMSGDRDTLSTTSVALGPITSVDTVTIPDIPSGYSFVHAEILDSNGNTLCQDGMTADQIGHLETTVTDDDIEDAADPESNPGTPVTVEDITPTTTTRTSGSPFEYCNQVPGGPQREACKTCLAGAFDENGNQTKIFSAVGCVNVSGKGLAADLIKLMLGIGGGVAMLSLLNAAFKLTVSRGDTTKVKEAKELVTASVTGLLFLIFSVIIMQFVGVQILHIPGLG